jgi:hypothetical protein
VTSDSTDLRDFRRRLRAVSDAVGGRALETAVVAGGVVVQREAVLNLKRNRSWRTGTLARSIHVDVVETAPDHAAVEVGTDVVYARRIEFGFMDTDSLGRRYHQTAKPYLRPALDEHRDEISREIADVLADQLRRATRE